MHWPFSFWLIIVRKAQVLLITSKMALCYLSVPVNCGSSVDCIDIRADKFLSKQILIGQIIAGVTVTGKKALQIIFQGQGGHMHTWCILFLKDEVYYARTNTEYE